MRSTSEWSVSLGAAVIVPSECRCAQDNDIAYLDVGRVGRDDGVVEESAEDDRVLERKQVA